jgi:hypothetical protein
MAEPKDCGLSLVEEEEGETLSKQETKAFNAIKAFVFAMFNSFGRRVAGLSKYKILLDKTTLEHVFAVKKNVRIFTSFIEENAESIQNGSKEFLASSVIEYSPNCRINFERAISLADDRIKATIWDHIIVIATHVHPSCVPKKAKDELVGKSAPDNEVTAALDLPDTKEGNMLKGIVNSVSEVLDADGAPANPMSAVTKLFSSTLMTDLASQFTAEADSGELDISNLLHAFGTMMSSPAVQETVSGKDK